MTMLVDIRIYPQFDGYLVRVTHGVPPRRIWEKTYASRGDCLADLQQLDFVAMSQVDIQHFNEFAHVGGVFIMPTEANVDQIQAAGFKQHFLN